MLLIALVILLLASPVSAQLVIEQPYTVGTNPPETRARVCIDLDGSCETAAIPFLGENHQQFVVGGATPGMNVQGDIINSSSAPGDNRAVAAWNAKAHGGSLLQAKTYGCNYVGFLSGINLACQSEVLGQFGLILTSPDGPARVVIQNEWVGTYQQCGMGFGGGCTSGKNVLTQGWGRAPVSIQPGEGSEWVDAATGHKMYWGVGTNGQHVFKCLTC